MQDDRVPGDVVGRPIGRGGRRALTAVRLLPLQKTRQAKASSLWWHHPSGTHSRLPGNPKGFRGHLWIVLAKLKALLINIAVQVARLGSNVLTIE